MRGDWSRVDAYGALFELGELAIEIVAICVRMWDGSVQLLVCMLRTNVMLGSLMICAFEEGVGLLTIETIPVMECLGLVSICGTIKSNIITRIARWLSIGLPRSKVQEHTQTHILFQ